MARQMLIEARTGCEDEARRIYSTGLRLSPKIALCKDVVAQQPKHAAGYRSQEPHPNLENRLRNLVAVVEGAEDEALIRQPRLAPRLRLRGDAPRPIIDLVAIRQMNDPFRVERLLVERQGH